MQKMKKDQSCGGPLGIDTKIRHRYKPLKQPADGNSGYSPTQRSPILNSPQNSPERIAANTSPLSIMEISPNKSRNPLAFQAGSDFTA